MSGIERWAPSADGVYVLFCKPMDGWTYVKVGNSSSIPRRLAALTTGCPFEYGKVIWARMPSYELAYKVEATIHRKLKPFNTTREWFRFRLDDPEHKTAFHTATRLAFAEVLGISPTERIAWNEISVSALRADYNKAGRRRHNAMKQNGTTKRSISQEGKEKRADILKALGVLAA